MSQQKVLIVACFLAGAVALVSGQSLDWQKCSSDMRAAADSYRQGLTSAGQRFTNDMQNAGAQATDISSIQKDIDKMSNSIAKLTDMSNGFDMGALTNAYMENFSTMSSIMRNSMRFDMIPQMMGSYMDMFNTIMSENTKLMESVTKSCVPASRLFRLRQTV